MIILQEKIDTVTVEEVEYVREEDCIEMKTEQHCIALVRTVKAEQEVSVLYSKLKNKCSEKQEIEYISIVSLQLTHCLPVTQFAFVHYKCAKKYLANLRFNTRLVSTHYTLYILIFTTPQGGMFPEVSHLEALLGSLVIIS